MRGKPYCSCLIKNEPYWNRWRKRRGYVENSRTPHRTLWVWDGYCGGSVSKMTTMYHTREEPYLVGLGENNNNG